MSEIKFIFFDGGDWDGELDFMLFLMSIFELSGCLVVCCFGDVFYFFCSLDSDGDTWIEEY